MTLDPGRPESPEPTAPGGPTHARSAGSGAVFAWGLAIAWAALIWGLGSDGFSVGTTSRFLAPMLERMLPGISAADLGRSLLAIRSLAHAVEYGVLALFAYHALRRSPGPNRLRSAVFALALCLALAVADETRQAGSAVRTGSPLHVSFDLAGALLALGALRLMRPRLVRWVSPRSAGSGA